jgi:AcrR family transcriptional regulator
MAWLRWKGAHVSNPEPVDSGRSASNVRRVPCEHPGMSRAARDSVLDARKERSQQAILGAFFRLVLERRYASIRIGDIVARSGVGRSTFYEHFRNKDELLATSLEGPFSILAESTLPGASLGRLTDMLEHFWSNREVARGLLTGAMRRRLSATLARTIEVRLRRTAPSTAWSARTTSVVLAEMLLTPIGAWLSGEVSGSARDLADGLRAATQAAVRALTHQRSAGA